jgi:dihydroflavonol-4-reductase
MKILITGATGFIGSHLVERLGKSGHQIRCIAKDPLNVGILKSAGYEVILGDLNNGVDWDMLLDGIDLVYHVAGVTRCTATEEYYEGNYRATKRLIEICSLQCTHLKRFVYVSSLSAIGPSLNGRPVEESTPYHPVSHYGKSKMLAEIEVQNASSRLPITIVRPSAVYGPRERDMYDYIKLIKKGIELLIGFGEKLLSLIYCEDLVRGIQLAGESPVAIGKTYFLGSEQFYTVRDLGQTIARVVVAHPVNICLPHAVVYGVGAAAAAIGILTHQQVFFNLEKARESVQPAWTCSVEQAKNDLGFRQMVSLEEGMRKTYRWYCENGWL